MIKKISARALSVIGFSICCGLVAFAVYLQIYMNIQPCPLCILERIFFGLIGIVLLVAILHNPGERGYIIYGGLILIMAISGMLVAGRHIWLQSQPITIGQLCVPGLSYLFANLPISDALKTLVVGTADCAKVSWRFLGLSIPMWTFLFFDMFALLGIIHMRGLLCKKMNCLNVSPKSF